MSAHPPQIVPAPDNEPWPEIDIRFPPSLPDDFAMGIYALEPPEALDPRLKEYRLRLLLSTPTPDDPSPWVIFVIGFPGETAPRYTWRLWRIWLRWREAPILGELRFDETSGWVSSTIAPQVFQPAATRQEEERTHYGLRLLRQQIPRPGRRRRFSTAEECREAFIQQVLVCLSRGRIPSQKSVSLAIAGDPSGNAVSRDLQYFGLSWKRDIVAEAYTRYRQ
jgi:hypothetical protein